MLAARLLVAFQFRCARNLHLGSLAHAGQHQNKASALRVLAARIRDVQVREQQAKEAATRRSLVGSGDRSERIRTYNFPQGRLTDHRINLTLYKLDAVLQGELDEVVAALTAEHQAELLAALADENG